MININIVFDGAFEDADIIAVPDEIAPEIKEIGQQFLDWVPNAKEKDYWTIINEQRIVVAETDGFIKWLNSCYCTGKNKAFVVARNTNYCPRYKTIEF